MPFTVTPYTDNFAAEVTGLDIGQALSDDDRDALVRALDRYAVAVVRGRPVSEDAQFRFAARFGPMEPNNGILTTDIERRITKHLVDISNLDESGDVLALDDRRRLFNLGNRLWHTDSSFKRQAATYSMLHAHVIPPEGGETEITDMRAAYDALDQPMRERIQDLVAVHSIHHSRATLGFTEFTAEERETLPPIRRPLVRTHPGSGRQCLYLASHAGHILGRPTPEARILLADLMEHATQPAFVHTHHWQVGDLLIWDNRCTMHRARPFDELGFERDMRRATVVETTKADVQADELSGTG